MALDNPAAMNLEVISYFRPALAPESHWSSSRHNFPWKQNTGAGYVSNERLLGDIDFCSICIQPTALTLKHIGTDMQTEERRAGERRELVRTGFP